jgi:hypothetical protein
MLLAMLSLRAVAFPEACLGPIRLRRAVSSFTGLSLARLF